jgi:CRISPR-associated endonuclease/helicase Cas3
VILQAPTGAGKTKAALIPFLQNLAQQGNALPHTCRYAVPLRVLANQFFREYESIATRIDLQGTTHLVETYRSLERNAIALQTGEQPEDPQMEAVLTFCTIDQLLASFLAVPYGVGTNRANLNVGGVIGSFLVLDEFHLYPLLREGKSVFGARTTAIQMLRLLKSITPFVLMTATFSTSLLNQLKVLLDAEIVTVTDPAELREIAQGRGRTFRRSQTPMDAEVILREHQQRQHNRCTLIVCNTVLRAQKLFLQLKKAEDQGTRVVLLHSRFSTQDRKRLSEEIEQELGPEKWENGAYLGRDIIVIATQVVEVGLDISAQVLHTENAPANSLIQRAGRCARFAHEHGQVIIYPLPPDDEGKEASTLPYDQSVCSATWNALEQFEDKEVGFVEEQALIDAVHTQEDEDLLKRFDKSEGDIVSRIFESFNTNHRGISSTLIRDVAQVQILIHDDPGTGIEETPWRWQSFSMHPDSLVNSRRWRALQEQAFHSDVGWIYKEAKPVIEERENPDGADGIDNRQKTRYVWEVVNNPESVRQALIIAMPPELARYDDQLGFVMLDGQLEVKPNDYKSTLLPASIPDSEKGGSQQTSYQKHIEGLVHAYNAGIKSEIYYVTHRLEQQMELPNGIIDQAIRLAIACHDLGKLNQTWQQWALSWQKLVWEKLKRISYQLPDPSYCFAKTNFNYSREQRKWQNEVQPKRPTHACESVAIARNLIGMSLGITRTDGKDRLPVLRAACGAIARHHTSQASKHGTAILNEQARKAAEEALKAAHQGATWSYNPSLLIMNVSSINLPYWLPRIKTLEEAEAAFAIIEMNTTDTKDKLTNITRNEGFKRIAYAIRQSTITAQYRRAQLGDRTYEVRYGLGQELMREARYRNKFMITLSEFLQRYNAETSREEEKVANKLGRKLTPEDRRVFSLRASIPYTDIDEIADLIDRYNSSELIGSMLVAYGYAREPRKITESNTTDIEIPNESSIFPCVRAANDLTSTVSMQTKTLSYVLKLTK